MRGDEKEGGMVGINFSSHQPLSILSVPSAARV